MVKPNRLTIPLLYLVLVFLTPAKSNAQEASTSTAESHAEIIDWLTAEMLEADTSEVPPHTAIYYVGGSAAFLSQLKRPKLALTLWQRCKEIDQQTGSQNARRLFGFAVDIGRLDLAEQLQQSSPELQEALRPALLLAKYAQGDDGAIDQCINSESKMTFYTALDIANAYIKKGLYDKAENFVVNATITKENAPEDLIGITFANIARRCRKLDDQEQALLYVDKALVVAGNQYYTGQSIKVCHHSIHATLHESVKALAATAERYRGHQARELTQSLIRQLLDDKLFEDARMVIKKLEAEKDVVRSLQSLAAAQANAADYREAFQTLKALKKPEQRNVARIEIAKAMARTGHVSTARETANFVVENLANATADDSQEASLDEQRMALATFYTQINDAEQLKTQQEALKNATTRLKSLKLCLEAIAPNK